MDYRNLDIDDQDESETKLINALASGNSVVASAEISGISQRTIHRRKKQPDFRRKVAAKRGELLSAALGDLTDAAAEAAAKLRELANSKNEWVAAAASRAITQLAAKLRTEVDLEDRLCNLEDRASKEDGDDLQYSSNDGDDGDDSEGPLVASLASGKTVSDCAQVTGISERTIYRRLGQWDFRRRIAATRGEMLATTLGILTEAAREATSTLRRLMSSKTQWVALYAARAILELSVDLRSDLDVQERLQALEDRNARRREEEDDGE